MLSNRSQAGKINNALSESKLIECGVPQELLMFNIFLCFAVIWRASYVCR